RPLAALVVDHHRHAARREVLLEPHQHAREHVQCAGRHALAGRQPDLAPLAARAVHEAVVGTEDVSVPVDDVELFRHSPRTIARKTTAPGVPEIDGSTRDRSLTKRALSSTRTALSSSGQRGAELSRRLPPWSGTGGSRSA